jgi:histidinol-phosphate aminotransferase
MKFSAKKIFRPEVLKSHAYTLSAYPKAVKLNQNELPYDFPPRLKEELFRRIKKLPLQRYPRTQPERLQKRLARALAVGPENILFSNGSNVMIQALILSIPPKGKVLSLEPGFGVFESETQLLGNRYVPVRLKAPHFNFPLEEFLSRMKRERPHLIFIANPNAPTGNLFPTEALLEVIARASCPVVVDEAYYQFSGVTLLPRLKRFPNLMILRTFSKGFGMGGARVGYLVSRKELIREVGKVLMPYCLPVLSEETALLALEHAGHFKKIIAQVCSERERVFSAMQKLPAVECFSSRANFILFRVKSAGACFAHLLKKGVLVRNMSGKSGLEGCLRVSIGRPRENDAFLKALASYS